MMRNFIFILSVLALAACNKAPEIKGFSVKGVVKNYANTSITLQELTPRGLIFIDSSTVDANGAFELNGRLTEKAFGIIQFPTGSVVLVLDSLSDMILNIDASKPEEFTVNGSTETSELKELLVLNNKYMQQIQALNNKYAAYIDHVPPLEVQHQIRNEFDSIMTQQKFAISTYASSLENSMVPYFTTNFDYFQLNNDYEFIQQIDNKLYNQFIRSKYAQELHQKVKVLGKTAIGSVAPDIVMADPFGKTVSLSSLRGKIVLIDFWASWCRPCREENPHVVKMYNQYKSRGFEVFSVSLDDSREAWQKAINDDKLLWTHVSDLQKWNSAVVAQYNIESIPHTILIDADGKIIAKNLRGEKLTEKLAELFKQ